MFRLLSVCLLALSSVSADSSAASAAAAAVGNANFAWSQAEAKAWVNGASAQAEAWSRAIASPTSTNAVQPYCSSLLLLDSIYYYLRAYILNWQVPQPWQRSYAAILNARLTVSQKVLQGQIYDVAYNINNILAVLSSTSPVTARNAVLNLYYNIINRVLPMINLVRNVLYQTQNAAICDAQVDAIVRANPAWNKIAALTIQTGKLGQEYLKIRGNIEYAAVNLAENQLYINGKTLLQKWILQTFTVLSLF